MKRSVGDNAGVEQSGSLEGIFLAKIGADEVLLGRAHRLRPDHVAAHLVKATQQDIFNVAMARGEAGDDPRQFRVKLCLPKRQNTVGKALSAAGGAAGYGAAGLWGIICRGKGPQHHAGRISAQHDWQVG